MAFTKPDVSYVRLDSAQIWAAKDGTIHITSDDTSVTLCARVPDPEALEGLLVAGRQLGLRVVRVRPLSG